MMACGNPTTRSALICSIAVQEGHLPPGRTRPFRGLVAPAGRVSGVRSILERAIE